MTAPKGNSSIQRYHRHCGRLTFATYFRHFRSLLSLLIFVFLHGPYCTVLFIVARNFLPIIYAPWTV